MLRTRLVAAIGYLMLAGSFLLAPQPGSAQVPQLLVPATISAPAAGLPAALNIDVLNVVPDDAFGLITAHHLRDTQKMVENIFRKLEVPIDDLADYDEFNQFLDRLRGWDDKGTHAMAFIPIAGRPTPEVAVFVPVTNYKEFARSMGANPDADGPTEFEVNDGPEGYIAAKAQFAVLTENNAEGRAVIDAVLSSKKSLASANEPLRKWISDHQLAGVVTTNGVQRAIDLMLEGLAEAKNDVPDEPIPQILTKLFFPTLESLLKATRDEMTHLAAAPSLDDVKGLRFSARAVFKNDGKYSAAVNGVPTLPADYLAHLPEEGLFTASAYVYPEKLTEAVIDFALTALEAVAKEGDLPLDVSVWKPVLEKGREAGRGIKYVSAVQSFKGESMYEGMGGIYKVEDSAAFTKDNEAVMKQMTEALRKMSDKFPEIAIEKKQVAGVEATVTTVDMLEMMSLLSNEAFAQQEAQAMFKSMIGNDGKLMIYTGAVDKQNVAFAMGETTFKALVENIREGKPGLADDVMVKKTAALLPTGTAMAGYVDIGGYIDLIKTTMTKAMAMQPGSAAGPGMFAQLIPAFPEAPPLGYSIKVTPTTIEGDMVIPMDLMEAARDYAKQVQALIGAGLR